MTSKEIAMSTVRDIARSCDTALGYGAWQYQAEQHVGSAFSAARANRKMVKCAFSMSQRFGECMCMAVGSVLSDWLRFKMLRGYEVQRAYKMLEE